MKENVHRPSSYLFRRTKVGRFKISRSVKAVLMASVLFFSSTNLTSAQQRRERYPYLLDLQIRDTTVVDVVSKRIIPHKSIGIRAGRIVAIEDAKTALHSKTVIDGSGYIALPGFVDTHTHLWQHICKACFPKEKLQQWVRVYQTIHYLTPDELYQVVSAASSEALLSGITTVCDYASLSFNDYGFEVNANAARDAGLEGVLVWNNPSVFLPDPIKLTEIPRLRGAYKTHFDIWMGFGGLSFYSLPQAYSGIRIAQTLGMHMTEHTMENIEEQRELYKKLSGYYETYKDKLNGPDRTMLEEVLAMKRPGSVDVFDQLKRGAEQALVIDRTQAKLTEDEKKILQQLKHERTISPMPVLDYFKVLPNYLSIHSVWQQQEDIELMRRNNVTVSLNPESNMYLSSGIAPIYAYLNAGILLTLGTDGAASNDAINSFSAMREMWNVYKIDLMNADVARNFDEWIVLQAATINGARALMLDGQTGSLSVGKEADIVLVSENELGMSPTRPDKIVPLLIYSANTRNVKYVISDGQVVVRDGSLVRYKETLLADALSTIAINVDERIRTGRIWRESYSIPEITQPWYRFRSVRKPDSIDLKIENAASYPVKVTVVSSGAIFGGGSCYMADAEVRRRFPEDCPKNSLGREVSFKKEIVISPRENVRILKASTDWEYKITTPSTVLTETSGSGQLLVLVEKASLDR